jgi:hypothetical protein
MISGYTLLDFRRRYGTADFLRRRFSRAGQPFLFWSILAWLLFERGGGVKELALSVANSTVMQVYWFFPHLFGCYAAILVLSYVQNKKRHFLLLTGLLFLSNSVLPFCDRLFSFGVSNSWKWSLGSEYIMFAMLGYLLGGSEFGRKTRCLIYLLGIVGFIMNFWCVWLLSPIGGPINMLFKGYMNWPSVLYSSAVFVAVKSIDWSELYRLRILAWMLNMLKNASFSIYLLHGFLVYRLFPEILPMLFGNDYGSLIEYRLFAPFVIVVICVAMHCLLNRIPVVCHSLGSR